MTTQTADDLLQFAYQQFDSDTLLQALKEVVTDSLNEEVDALHQLKSPETSSLLMSDLAVSTLRSVATQLLMEQIKQDGLALQSSFSLFMETKL